jgi:hypothetical protein
MPLLRQFVSTWGTSILVSFKGVWRIRSAQYQQYFEIKSRGIDSEHPAQKAENEILCGPY